MIYLKKRSGYVLRNFSTVCTPKQIRRNRFCGLQIFVYKTIRDMVWSEIKILLHFLDERNDVFRKAVTETMILDLQ